jgi:ribonucleoside-diphosphate reductase beta chain
VIAGYEHFVRLAARLQWDEAEIDLSGDAAPDARVAELIAGFCVGEAGVAEHLGPFAAAAPEGAARCFAAQERDEVRHARFFARAARELLDVSDVRSLLAPEFLELFEVRLPAAARAAAEDRFPGLRRGTELVLRDERWHVGFGTRCLIDAGLDEAAVLAEGERAAALWAPEQAERVLSTLRRRLAAIRSERVTIH